MDYLEQELIRINKEKAYNPLSNAEISRLELDERSADINKIIRQKTKLPANNILKSIIKDFHETIRD